MTPMPYDLVSSESHPVHDAEHEPIRPVLTALEPNFTRLPRRGDQATVLGPLRSGLTFMLAMTNFGFPR